MILIIIIHIAYKPQYISLDRIEKKNNHNIFFNTRPFVAIIFLSEPTAAAADSKKV
jgi:hypothetical protein